MEESIYSALTQKVSSRKNLLRLSQIDFKKKGMNNSQTRGNRALGAACARAAALMWREGNAGGTPSRAECAGVPPAKMPPPFGSLASPRCLGAHQTGRRLRRLLLSLPHAEKGDELRGHRRGGNQRKGDHYRCRQQLFCICTLSQAHLISPPPS